MYFHVYIELNDSARESITKLGYSEEDLKKKVIEPYNVGRGFVVNGSTIDPYKIKSIRVTRSTLPPQTLMAAAENERLSGPIVVGMAGFTEFLAWEMGEEVTDDFITGPAGSAAGISEAFAKLPASGNKVFIVHGHDGGLKNAVARFISALGLKPIILHEQPDGSRTIIEKFESEANVSFAVVLATSDDLAPGASSGSGPTRARPNVIFELGYFRGVLNKDRVALIKDPAVELPSDLSGVVYTRRQSWQSDLHNRLVDAGYSFDSKQTREALAIQE